MKVAMINGSPKQGASNSGLMLKALKPLIHRDYEITYYNINKKSLTNEQYIELCHVDTLVFAFPLYIDAVPSHLFRMMVTLEEYLKNYMGRGICVYAIINNGFYEGSQSRIALEIMKNWCKHSGLHFGQGFGQGAGEMMSFNQNIPLGHGPQKNLGKGMKSLANSINAQRTGESTFFSPNFPRFAWKFAATHIFWNPMAKKNGLKTKDIVRRIETH